ncbi:MAG: hypothetical protein ED556_09090 [Winogradskyella sp.]|uniref:hypothetical protein n=1 Tax=Winogradskyella sp. TaxID=1883156 RepID=UPI000F4156A1|nr:hypothetical protein [Winogradskyella sp.]RNC86435.1 MAG: hypothetical protein ED556_09090 [Winogradskyella sp.]
MKQAICILIFGFFTISSFSQKISSTTNYIDALELYNSGDYIMLIYFYDGENSKLERKIKNEILKSDGLKTFNKDIVILNVDKNTLGTEEAAINKRPVRAFNPENIYPSISASLSKEGKSLPLMTSFSDSDITLFFEQLKALK